MVWDARTACARFLSGWTLLGNPPRIPPHEDAFWADIAPLERAAAMDMLTGILRRRLTLDAVTRTVSNRSMETLDSPVRAVLWVGVYQLLLSDHVKDYAAIDSAVKLAGKLQAARAGGFINAVLRSVQRLRPMVKPSGTASSRACPVDHHRWLTFERDIFPPPARQEFLYWSQAASMPVDLVRTLFAVHGQGAVPVMIHANCRPPVICRVDRPDALSPSDRWRPHAQHGYVLLDGGINGDIRTAVERGDISPQDPTAGMAVRWLTDALSEHGLTPHSGQGQPSQVLDLCAGRGTKSVQLAMGGWRVTASDIAADKLQALAQREAQLRTGRITICQPGPMAPAPSGFDGVLVDAPCSNTGVLARRPEVRWRLPQINIEHILSTQLTLLSRGSELARTFLVYSTCSLLPDENQRLVKQFLSTAPGHGWRLIQEHTTLPIPDADRWCDGGYVALLQRT